MIEIKNVNKSYVKDKKVINNLSLNIKNGEIFGFLGPNGAGKTTLIKMITGILEAESGKILIDGKDIKTNPIQAKQKIGFVPDSPDVFLNLKGIEYLNFIGDIYKVKKEKRILKIEEISKKFDIYENLNEKIENYSHGMRQKIILIGTFMHEPQNLILDEPITGLDPKAIYELKNILKEYSKKGHCVFFSTHILEIAENLCDRVGIINKGNILFEGLLENLKDELSGNNTLEELFMEIIEND